MVLVTRLQEIVVDLMSTHNTAQNAYVLNKGKARIQFTTTSFERNISIGYILSLALQINLNLCNHKIADNLGTIHKGRLLRGIDRWVHQKEID